MFIVDSETMRRVDAAAIAAGTPSLTLMERAGAGATRAILRHPAWLTGTTLIVCGKGNNGGDGLVVARLLQTQGRRAQALLLGAPDQLSPDALVNLQRAREAGVEVVEIAADPAAGLRARDAAEPGRLLVDAVLGTGFKPPLHGALSPLVAAINDLGRRVVALDVPSGLDATTGAADPAAVRADFTVTFGYAKWGLVLPVGRRFCGRIERVDLELPRDVVVQEIAASAGHTALYVDALLAAGWWRERAVDVHKYSVGTVLVVGGSATMSGAVSLACLAALRAGAGLTVAAVPGSQRLAVDLTCTEVLVHGLAETEAGGISPSEQGRILALAQRHDAVLVGPGAGADLATAAMLVELLAALDRPAVVDADALNAFSRLQREPRLPARCVVTPHTMELSRLLNIDRARIEGDRVEVVRAAARELRAVVLHKGAPTMVAAPEGAFAVIGAGGPELASPGTGDVLAGVITALLAGGHDPFEAACLGAWLHGRAGERVAQRLGDAGLLARDLLPAVAAAAREAQESHR